MIKVFLPDNETRYDIIQLWTTCFGDSHEYISFFLDNCPDVLCIGFYSENKLRSMLFLLEGYINAKPCKYLYAACTDPDFRNRGIMGKLLNYTENYCKEYNYSAIFLVPANEDLYHYYSTFGYMASFRKRCVKLENSNKITAPLNSEIKEDIVEISNIKAGMIDKIEAFRFNNNIIKYTVAEHIFNGGEVLLYKNNNGICLAFYYKDAKNIIIKELLCNFDISLSVLKKLFFNKNVENIYIYAPIVYNIKDIGEEYTKCGMCLPLTEEMKAYLKNNTELYAGMYLD